MGKAMKTIDHDRNDEQPQVRSHEPHPSTSAPQDQIERRKRRRALIARVHQAMCEHEE